MVDAARPTVDGPLAVRGGFRAIDPPTHLHGIERLPKSRRLEAAPYATTRQERIDPHAANNPFNNGSRQVAGAGLDAKYGITSGLTLDATVNPDWMISERDTTRVPSHGSCNRIRTVKAPIRDSRKAGMHTPIRLTIP